MLNLQLNQNDLKAVYSRSGQPKFIVIDNLFESQFIKSCEEEFLSMATSDFVHYRNPLFEFEKFALNDKMKMPLNLRLLFEYIHSPEFVNLVRLITDISDLCVDEHRWGGGLHMTKKGGYLSVHKDFNVLPTTYVQDTQMLRCINLIGYLNSSWKDGDGGELEFWNQEGTEAVQKIQPKFNKWVLFDTRNNYHGHPYPYQGESPRLSVASYYYVKTNVEDIDWTSTEYLKLPWMEESKEYIQSRRDRADSKFRYKDLFTNGNQ